MISNPNLCRFLHALLVPAEAEGHQRPAGWKALPTASAVLSMLDHSCRTHFLGEVDWCSTSCTACWLADTNVQRRACWFNIQPNRAAPARYPIQIPVFVTASCPSRLLEKPFKSTLAHDAVAVVLSHKHHPIIHVGAGPIQLIYGSLLKQIEFVPRTSLHR